MGKHGEKLARYDDLWGCETKICSKCLAKQQVRGNFNRDPSTKDGYGRWCVSCNTEAQAARRAGVKMEKPLTREEAVAEQNRIMSLLPQIWERLTKRQEERVAPLVPPLHVRDEWDGHRKCNVCDQWYPLEGFTPNDTDKGTRRYTCRGCEADCRYFRGLGLDDDEAREFAKSGCPEPVWFRPCSREEFEKWLKQQQQG